MKKIGLVCFFLSLSICLSARTDLTANKNKSDNTETRYNKTFRFNTDSSECEFIGVSINTIFNVPLVRFNLNSRLNAPSSKYGSFEFLNCAGAGFSISIGRVNVRTDAGKKFFEEFDSKRSTTMKNILGISFGVLFSKSDSLAANRVIFTPCVGLQILDFHLGYGYELGDVQSPAHRSAFMISYGLPISKLTDAGSYLFPSKFKRAGGNNIGKVQGIF